VYLALTDVPLRLPAKAFCLSEQSYFIGPTSYHQVARADSSGASHVPNPPWDA